jgi:anti-sigma regulatory factor (Ser/Thr protein kinase)
MLELALHVLDILQNAVEAGATQVELTIVEDEAADRLTVTVTDNGRGMDEETLRRVLNPFYTSRTTRHVGLGLPLFAAAAETAGGELTIRSQPGLGTAVEATFQLSHPDRQPLGDMAATLLAFLLARGAPELRYAHRVVGGSGSKREFSFDTGAIRAELDGMPLSEPVVAQWLAEYLAEGEQELQQIRDQEAGGL